MTISSGPICVPLIAAVIVSALAYYKIDPVRRIFCAPFAYLLLPTVLLLVYLAGRVAGLDGPLFSAVLLALALAALAGALWQGRVLLPKTELR